MSVIQSQSTKLKGHQGAVLCLDHSSSAPSDDHANNNHHSPFVTAACLLSGAEDATARLWDLRMNHSSNSSSSCRASLCIQASGEVLSVAFGPTWERQNDVPSLLLARDLTVYLSTDSTVAAYDLRKANSPVVLDDPAWDLSTVLESTDEVNQIAFSPVRRGRPLHLAAADDFGSVRVTDCLQPTKDGRPVNISNEIKRRRVLPHGQASADAMVTSVAFRPRCKNLELASGGTDCTVQLWDVNKPKRALSVLTIPNTDAAANQVCNPPMVHALQWSPSGRLLAAACGDGSCCLLQAENRSLVLAARLEEHGGALASVIFPEWSAAAISGDSGLEAPSSSSHVAAQDRLLVTAGNDGAIHLWDLGSLLAGEGAVDPSRLLNVAPRGHDEDTHMHMDMDTTGTGSVAKQMRHLSLDTDNTDQPRVLCSISHGTNKPNWMVSSRGRDPVFPSSLFVADTSNDITVYTIPLQ